MNIHWSVIAISASWRILMLAKLRQLSVCFITQVGLTKSVKFTMVTPQWIGWSRSRSAVSQLPLLQQLVHGFAPKMVKHRQVSMAQTKTLRSSGSILLIHPDTLISQLKLSAHWPFLMALYVCLMRMPVLSHRRRQYGVRPTVITFRGLSLLTRWIKSALISLIALI